MDQNVFKSRTRRFALDAIYLVENLPRNRTCDVLGKQLIRCATSVGANYRAACRARSRADFIAKMGIVEEEADESLYWLELLIESGHVEKRNVETLTREGGEITAMVVASLRTAKEQMRRAKNPQSAIANPQCL